MHPLAAHFPKDITSGKRSNKASPHCICISKQRCASTPLGPVAKVEFLKQHFIPVKKGFGKQQDVVAAYLPYSRGGIFGRVASNTVENN